jgi:phosphate acetyltransferase
VELVRSGQAEVLMKGSLHSDELLGAVVAKDTGLRTATCSSWTCRRITRC